MFGFWRRTSVDAVHRDVVLLRREQAELREEVRVAFATIYRAIDEMRRILDKHYGVERPLTEPVRHASNGGGGD